MNTAVSFKVVPAPQTEPVLEPAPETVPASPPPAPASQSPVKPKGNLRKRLILGTLLVAALATAGWYGNQWYQVGRFTVSTDDAYVKTDKSGLSAKLAGLVKATPVANNGVVHAGDVVLQLDDADFKLALDAADGRIATQKMTIARIEQQLAAQNSVIAKANSQVTMAQSDISFAQSKLQRQSTLAEQKLASVQLRDDAASDVQRSSAALASAKADLDSAAAQQGVIAAQVKEAQAQLAELETARAKALRDLSQTAIVAPFDGVMSNRSVEVGQYVQPGQRIGFLVPQTKIYVEANFKETDLANLHEGQDVTITVDALHADIHGKVESISPASGAEFSLLPPENATGNFTKVVQRVPVRIAVDDADAKLLRAGFSVTASINTKG